MTTDFYQIFRYKFLLKEQEEEKAPPEEKEPSEVTNPESDLEKVLNNSKKVTYALVKLLSTYDNINEKSKNELRELINDIRCISYKPTTFRIILTNNNYFDIKYDPTPMQLKYPEDFKPMDMFYVTVLGKKYDLATASQYQQCIDYIQKIQRENPVLLKTAGEGEPGGPAGAGSEEAPPPPEIENPEEKK